MVFRRTGKQGGTAPLVLETSDVLARVYRAQDARGFLYDCNPQVWSERMEKNYEPQTVETRLYEEWIERGYFSPSEDNRAKTPYVITIPPPNVTGSLHMGHALSYTLQDILGRWKRMQGFNVLVLPGIDHAGIATQNVVEKEIAAEGLTRQELGREKFVERVWNWKERYGARIVLQLHRLGCSFDWSRERFTMDDDYVDAILEEFVRFYEKGWIYRGARVINWCPFHETAISDIEVEYVEQDSHLWHIRYPFADGSGEVIVATTRPETMLGDSAVAVNPDDSRYVGEIGKQLLLPLSNREIPLIADSYASMEFGTGAVKVTPAHDLNDFEAGLRHRLPQIVVIGGDGKMTAAAGDKYAGLTREEARIAVVADLTSGGYLVDIEDYKHSVGTCERCHTIIEPLLSEQWFVKMAGTEMIERTLEVIRDGSITFVPERYQRISVEWLENIRDWCISRQLWWGHRIPVYYASDGRSTASKTADDAAKKLGVDVSTLRQDEDVLDTWFSSALWPFATLGWPRNTSDFSSFYPTNVLVTAREILFLWVARMIMTGVEFTGQIPFSDVYIYATVLDKQGRRMSKSLGNGIDPIEMIEKYGTDALRFSLVRLASKGQDIKFSEDRIPESRNFCTKIWNASRFALINLEGFESDTRQLDDYSLPERWILSRLYSTVKDVNASLGSYDIDEACKSIYEFFWNDFCDWFVELSKSSLRSENVKIKTRAQWVLHHVLETSLRLLHPIMPFVTEEIWQSLPGASGTIMVTPYPSANEMFINPQAESAMIAVIDSVRAIRNARGELSVPPGQTIDAIIVANHELAVLLSENSGAFLAMARTHIVFSAEKPSNTGVVALPITPGLDIYLPLAGLIDVEKEKTRINKEMAAVDKDLAQIKSKLENPMFVSRAAADVVAKAKAAEVELTDKKLKLAEQLREYNGH
jgi:valyl-tRNA synthetase